jgi:hypothetical protein
VEHSDCDYLDNLVRDLLWLLAYQNQPTDKELLRVGLEKFDGTKLYQLCREVRLSIVEIGASASESDSRTHRDIILDALVRIDCGFEWTGREPPIVPSAGDVTSEAFRLRAHARRCDLDGRPDQDVGEECRKVLRAQTAWAARHQQLITNALEETRSRMRALVTRKHRYRPAFLEAGRRLRELNVSPKRACEYLRTHPIEWSDGMTITAIPQTGRILIMRGAEELGSISEEQFRKEYMKFSASGRRRKV